MCYCSIATVTDYDAWKEEAVDIKMVLDTMSQCLKNVTRILEIGLPMVKKDRSCGCWLAAEESGA